MREKLLRNEGNINFEKTILVLIYLQITFDPCTRPLRGLKNRTFAFSVFLPIAKVISYHGTRFASRARILCIRKPWTRFPIPHTCCIGSQKVLLQYNHLVWIIKYNIFPIRIKAWMIHYCYIWLYTYHISMSLQLQSRSMSRQ